MVHKMQGNKQNQSFRHTTTYKRINKQTTKNILIKAFYFFFGIKLEIRRDQEFISFLVYAGNTSKQMITVSRFQHMNREKKAYSRVSSGTYHAIALKQMVTTEIFLMGLCISQSVLFLNHSAAVVFSGYFHCLKTKVLSSG